MDPKILPKHSRLIDRYSQDSADCCVCGKPTPILELARSAEPNMSHDVCKSCAFKLAQAAYPESHGIWPKEKGR
jgi:hypothetical protein